MAAQGDPRRINANWTVQTVAQMVAAPVGRSNDRFQALFDTAVTEPILYILKSIARELIGPERVEHFPVQEVAQVAL